MDSELTSAKPADSGFPPVITLGRSKRDVPFGGLADQALTVTDQEARWQDHLVSARLGVASALFAALRVKHPPTARHSLRVSLRCSAIAEAIGMTESERGHLEIAALLHDLGKIGVPDKILMKPGPLEREEFAIVKRHHANGLQILSQFCDEQSIVESVCFAHHRFDGTTQPGGPSGYDLPLGARVLSIADAYDAMTSDQVYRPAMTHDRAIAELFKNVPGQFDPQLVETFAQVLPNLAAVAGSDMTTRWLRELSSPRSDELWRDLDPTESPTSGHADAMLNSLFHQHLLEAMHDAVIFIDAFGKIVSWNRGAERMTGISPEAAHDREWAPTMLAMRDLDGNLIRHCPVAQAMTSGVQSLDRLKIAHANSPREEVAVNVHAIPVLSSDRHCRGVTVILHDASSEHSLEERVQNLHEKATTDPLTQVANRAEFDRQLEESVRMHLDSGQPCSLIICDIDHFKRVNDDFGHQAGDEALIAFAKLLKQSVRQEDFVARYGGEEFVILSPDCSNADAARKAEKIRGRLERMSQPMLHGNPMTASFGVTEIQVGDTPETMLRRTDRGLYQAKEDGRNQVVQLGSGLSKYDRAVTAEKWSFWKRATSKPREHLLQRTLVADGPMNIVSEKIRGFVADHHAQIISSEASSLTVEVDSRNVPELRRNSDRNASMLLDLELSEDRSGDGVITHIRTSIRPKRARDRRSAVDRGRQLLSSLKAYLIARELP